MALPLFTEPPFSYLGHTVSGVHIGHATPPLDLYFLGDPLTLYASCTMYA